MLGDIKTLLEIVESIFSIRKNEHERLVPLFEQLSNELQALADEWQSIVARLRASGSLAEDQNVLHSVHRQGSHFSALATIIGVLEDAPRWRVDDLRKAELVSLVYDALATKGRLYSIVHNAIYPDIPLMEMRLDYSKSYRALRERLLSRADATPTSAVSEGEAARVIAKHQKEWDFYDLDRATALNRLETEVADLQRRAGEIRGQLALYKARLIE